MRYQPNCTDTGDFSADPLRVLLALPLRTLVRIARPLPRRERVAGAKGPRAGRTVEQISFVFTIFFMLLGPIKLIPAFAGATRGADGPFKRSVAIRAAVIASALCVFVALVGVILLSNYRISVNAVRIGGGLVLLIAALQATFGKTLPARPRPGTPSALQLAASPVAIPGIVPPAGVAAILLVMMHAPQYAGMTQAVAICLALVMAMDFLVMYFIDQVVRTPGLTIGLTVFGSALLFVQVCLAIEMMLVALRDLRVLQAFLFVAFNTQFLQK